MLIEQAIFASAITSRAQGYQLVSGSAGLIDSDAREIAAWGPSHDSLLPSPGAVSVNFQRLASGQYLVSRTTQAGAEYSGRGGATVYTRCLVVPPQVFAQFSNNAFALVRAATAAGALAVIEPPPEALEPLRLGGKAAPVDQTLLARLARKPGPGAMATFIQTALATDHVAVATSTSIESLIAGFICTLPVECRAEFSFASGLRFSARRAGRISALGDDRSTWNAIARQGVTLIDLDSIGSCDAMHWQGWAGHVAETLAAGNFSLLAAELAKPRPGLTVADLDTLAEELTRSRSARAPRPEQAPAEPEPPQTLKFTRPDDEPPSSHRADGAHRSAAAELQAHSVAAALCDQSPEAVEMLERVDDLVFAAIRGDERALAELEVVWPTVQDELDADVVEQSREQYLKCALSIWSECVDGEVQPPERAVAAIDVLCVLFGE